MIVEVEVVMHEVQLQAEEDQLSLPISFALIGQIHHARLQQTTTIITRIYFNKLKKILNGDKTGFQELVKIYRLVDSVGRLYKGGQAVVVAHLLGTHQLSFLLQGMPN